MGEEARLWYLMRAGTSCYDLSPEFHGHVLKDWAYYSQD